MKNQLQTKRKNDFIAFSCQSQLNRFDKLAKESKYLDKIFENEEDAAALINYFRLMREYGRFALIAIEICQGWYDEIKRATEFLEKFRHYMTDKQIKELENIINSAIDRVNGQCG